MNLIDQALVTLRTLLPQSGSVNREDIEASTKALLKLPNYMQNLPQKVDIVHCWYVVHHVRVRELKDFFDFVYRQLKPRGYFLFNYPDYTTTKNPGNFGDTCWGPNGTAKHTRDSIVGEIRGTIIDEKSGPGHTQNFLTQL